jgi:hypothetical protein
MLGRAFEQFRPGAAGSFNVIRKLDGSFASERRRIGEENQRSRGDTGFLIDEDEWGSVNDRWQRQQSAEYCERNVLHAGFLK